MKSTVKSTNEKPTKRKLNIKLLRKLQKHILGEPRRFFMEGVVITGKPGRPFNDAFWYTDVAAVAPECGTAACIHGWTALLSGKKPYEAKRLSYDWSRRKLGLSRLTTYLDPLFDLDAWPNPFRKRYSKAKRAATRAKIGAARIEHLIKTGE